MKPIYRRLILGALVVAHAVGAGASTALAQGGLISLDGVQLSGTGCPAPGSITAMLIQNPQGMPQLQILFPKADPAQMQGPPFQALGPNEDRDCTVAMQL